MTHNLVLKLELTGPGGTKTEVVLGESTTIGRQAGNAIVLDDQRVSRQHAVIVCQAGTCHITDLGSSNGTYLAGERLAANVPTPLPPGAQVTMGSFSLTLRTEPLPEPGPEGAGEQAGQSRGSEGAEVPPDTVPPVVSPSLPPVSPPRSETRTARPPSPPPAAPEFGGRRLLDYLPAIYHTEFMSRFLGIFEATLTPIEWTIDNFDLFLDPGTAPDDFLCWLAGWFDIALDPSWSDAQRRQLLREAYTIYARRGTRWSLSRVLEIYTGQVPRIDDNSASLEPFTFKVILPPRAAHADRELIEHLIDAHKPAHTAYTLEFT